MMLSEEMEKSLFNSPGPPPSQLCGPQPTQSGVHPPIQSGGPSLTWPGGHPPHTIKICSSKDKPLEVPSSTPDDPGSSFMEVCSAYDQDQSKKPDLEFCSILYGPENLNIERCSSILPGNTLCLPSNCSLSPIRRGSSVSELNVLPMDLEDSVFLSPGKSARGFPPSSPPETSEPKASEAALPLRRLLCLSSCVLALPLLRVAKCYKHR